MRSAMLPMLIMLMMACFVAAQGTNQVHIYKIHYDNRRLSIVNHIIVEGFAPDRLLQPERGHSFEIKGIDGMKLYDFKFKVPLILFTDRSLPGLNLTGGFVILNVTDFALVAPYFVEEERVDIYDEDGRLVLTKSIRELPGPEKRGWWVWILGGLIVVGAAVFFVIRKKRQL